jgi:hypothetical protein
MIEVHHLTKRFPHPGGADILAVDDGARVAIQAKRWSRPVRLDAIRALLDGIARHDCARGIAVTTSFFTDQARECAAAHGIELWDRWKLGEFVAGDAPVVDRGVCAECGTAVSEGITRFCTAHPARFDGHVYCLHHQKRANRSI